MISRVCHSVNELAAAARPDDGLAAELIDTSTPCTFGKSGHCTLWSVEVLAVTHNESLSQLHWERALIVPGLVIWSHKIGDAEASGQVE